MAVSAERKAELLAELEELIGHKKNRPKADPIPSRDKGDGKGDGNGNGWRRNDFVLIRMDLYEAQMREKAEEKRRRRELDPYRMGLYGPVEDDE